MNRTGGGWKAENTIQGEDMDLRMFYQKIREVQSQIEREFPLVVSLATADGGKAGMKTEVPKRIAAKMLVEGQARLASQEEIEQYERGLAEQQRIAEQNAAAARVQISVLSTSELAQLRADARENTKG
jgi:hypothetical protein